jgi:hypothetical protein
MKAVQTVINVNNTFSFYYLTLLEFKDAWFLLDLNK